MASTTLSGGSAAMAGTIAHDQAKAMAAAIRTLEEEVINGGLTRCAA
jgi:hypothetical protein